MRRPVAVVWALAAAVLLWPQASGAQWDKSIDWLILCTSYLEEQGYEACDATHSAGTIPDIKNTLDVASRWLEGLEFRSPRLSASIDLARHLEGDWSNSPYRKQQDPRCETRYCAWLVDGLGPHGSYSFWSSSLTIDPFDDKDGSLAPGYPREYGFTEVHELFHAVQFAYPEAARAHGYGMGAKKDENIRWIIEGSATHVEVAAGRSVGLSVGPVMAFRYRTYDQPLHIPPTDGLQQDAWAYGSWEFFDFLGDHLHSADGVQYLKSLLAILRPGQQNGLEAVKAVVRDQLGVGLFEVFPEFVRRRLVSPCYFSHLGKWTSGGDCVEGRDNEHRFALAFPDTVRRWEHRAAEHGANGYLLRTKIPEEKVGGLVIRVPPEQDEERLHLIVDDERLDKPAVAHRRNQYLAVLPAGRHEFLVRLVNVPRDSLAHRGISRIVHNAPIEFILTELEGCRPDVMWNAIHPTARALRGLLPPAEYQRRYEPDPALRPAPGYLRIDGLASDAGLACVAPLALGSGADPEGGAEGEEIQRRIEEMSPEELLEMGMPLIEAWREGAGGGELTAEALSRGVAGLETPVVDSLLELDRGTLIRLFSPNAIAWQSHHRTDARSRASALGVIEEDIRGGSPLPMVPYAHGGVGGWSANASAHVFLDIPGVAPAELREESTYEARGGLQYGRGEGYFGHRGSVGWREGLRHASGEGDAGSFSLSGEVTITRITGAAVHGTFRLSGTGLWNRLECPREEPCRSEERPGPLHLTGSFMAPAAHITRQQEDEEGDCRTPPCPRPPPPEECTGPECDDRVPEEPEECQGPGCPPEPPTQEDPPERRPRGEPAQPGPGGAPELPPPAPVPGGKPAPPGPTPGAGAAEAAAYLEFRDRPKRLEARPEVVSEPQPVGGGGGMEVVFHSTAYRLRLQPPAEELEACGLSAAARQALDGLAEAAAAGRLEVRVQVMRPAVALAFGPVQGWTLRASASGGNVELDAGRGELVAAVRAADLTLQGPAGETAACPGLLDFELRVGGRP